MHVCTNLSILFTIPHHVPLQTLQTCSVSLVKLPIHQFQLPWSTQCRTLQDFEIPLPKRTERIYQLHFGAL